MHPLEKKEWTFVFALLFVVGFFLVLWNVQITGRATHTTTDDFSSGCIPIWHCSPWTPCSDIGKQTRSCIDRNNCGVAEKKRPTEERSCVPLPCMESWDCTLWSECEDGVRTRLCVDKNSCGTTQRKPLSVESCQVAEPVGVPSLIKARWGFLWILIPLAIVFTIALIVIGVLTKKEKEMMHHEETIHRVQKEGEKKEEKKPSSVAASEKEVHKKPTLKIQKKGYDKSVYVEPDVLRFVKDARVRGVSKEVIREQLARVGWSRDVIEKALDSVK